MTNAQVENEALLRAFRINWQDLDDNRSGRISRAQKRKIAGHVMILSALVAVIVPFTVLIVMAADYQAGALSFGVMMAAVAFLIGHEATKFYKDLTFDEVRRVSGTAEVQRVQRRQILHYVTIGDIKFLVDGRIYHAVKTTTAYTAYYRPSRPTLLALEVADASD